MPGSCLLLWRVLQAGMVDAAASACHPCCMKNLFFFGGFIVIALASVLHAVDASVILNNARLGGVAFDAIPGCRLPVGVVSHSDQEEMPASLRKAVKQKLGDLVSPNAPFDATDVVKTGHNRRLIFIWVRGNIWVVATEHGGRGYNDPILAYTVEPRGMQPKLLAERVAYPNSVCSTAAELLNQQPIAAAVEHR